MFGKLKYGISRNCPLCTGRRKIYIGSNFIRFDSDDPKVSVEGTEQLIKELDCQDITISCPLCDGRGYQIIDYDKGIKEDQ